MASVNQTVDTGREDIPPLSEAQEYALIALMDEPTLPAAAKAAGVAERTLRGWLVEDETFILRHRLEGRKRFAAIVRSLQEKTPILTRQLLEIAADEKAPARRASRRRARC